MVGWVGGVSKPRYVLMIAAVLTAVLSVPRASARAADAIHDPIPQDPIASGLGLVVKEFGSFPKSEPTPPPTDQRLMRWARINYIGEVPDGSGRRYVPDLNGKL